MQRLKIFGRRRESTIKIKTARYPAQRNQQGEQLDHAATRAALPVVTGESRSFLMGANNNSRPHTEGRARCSSGARGEG